MMTTTMTMSHKFAPLFPPSCSSADFTLSLRCDKPAAQTIQCSTFTVCPQTPLNTSPIAPLLPARLLRSANWQIIWENTLVSGRLYQSVILGFFNHEPPPIDFPLDLERTFFRRNSGQIWWVRLSEMGNKAFQWTFSSNLVNLNTNSSKLGLTL